MPKGKTKICHKCFKIVPLRHKCPHEENLAKEENLTKEEIDKYYKKSEWTSIRKKVLKLHPKCARCEALVKEGRKEYNPLDYMYGNDKVDVHHIHKVRLREDLAFDISNLVPLCRHCHSFVDKHCRSGELDFNWIGFEGQGI